MTSTIHASSWAMVARSTSSERLSSHLFTAWARVGPSASLRAIVGHGGVEVVGGDDAGDEPDLVGALRGDVLGEEDQLLGPLQADQAGEQPGAEAVGGERPRGRTPR